MISDLKYIKPYGVLLESEESYDKEAFNKFRSALSMVFSKYGFFATLLSKLNILEHKNLKYKTMATDGRCIAYDPDYVKSLTFKNIIWVICHEIMHNAMLHFDREAERNHELWNIAADAAVNLLLDDVGEMTEGSIYDKQFAGMSAERIYDILASGKVVEVETKGGKKFKVKAVKNPGEVSRPGSIKGGTIIWGSTDTGDDSSNDKSEGDSPKICPTDCPGNCRKGEKPQYNPYGSISLGLHSRISKISDDIKDSKLNAIIGNKLLVSLSNEEELKSPYDTCPPGCQGIKGVKPPVIKGGDSVCGGGCCAKNDPNKPPIPPVIIDGGGSGSGSCQSKDFPDQEKLRPGGSKSNMPGRDESKLKGQPGPHVDPSAVKRKWAKWVKENAHKSRGIGNGAIADYFMKKYRQLVDWKGELKKFLKNIYSKTRSVLPYKRFASTGKYIFGPKVESQAIKNLVIMIDTSGSISDLALSAFLSEIEHIAKSVEIEGIWLLIYDYDLQPDDIHFYKHAKDIDSSKIKARGRGGTAFTPGFEWIRDNLLKFNKVPGAVLYLTDGFAPFPAISDVPYYNKCMWILVDDKAHSITPPFGKVVNIFTEDLIEI